MIRQSRQFFSRWKFLIFGCCVTYLLVFYLPPKDEKVYIEMASQEDEIINKFNEPKALTTNIPLRIEPSLIKKEVFNFNPVGKEPFFVEEVMTDSPIKLAERMKCNVKKGEKRVILSWNAGHSQENLNGCKDWNCEYTHDRSKVAEAAAVLLSHQDPSFIRQSLDQYVIYFSQQDYFNMSLGFRHDTAASSPYGYTVKLGPKSRKTGEIVDKKVVEGKSKGAAWFVSHCSTNSRREAFVHELQKHFPVDIYGGCGTLKCQRNTLCESMLDTDYHFYVAFENSICKDYNTEKLWRQGFQRTIIPLVLKRSLAEPFVPPNSFLAVDDYKTVEEMAQHMQYLMKNHTAYMEYFEWQKDYKVVFLDGSNHDVLERPWGFCQVCRLVWEQPRQYHVIEKWSKFWQESCEKDGSLVNTILAGSL
ncbi:unnamed protein product [Caenorhabditis auriculariae]|uniref:Fucosyltransferase n=1 Tax=Caenorhabditis auriculariae TaxID=2777116 RepID=A0A8S1H6Z6_9PELO|nr:unnamed protein product [Caenorhabditis auriculariae]